MKKFSKQFKKALALLCFVGIFCQSLPANAENKLRPVDKETQYLKGNPTLIQESAIPNTKKYLKMMRGDLTNSSIKDPFDRLLVFPRTTVIAESPVNSTRSSVYILQNLNLTFNYITWDFETYPELQLLEKEGYRLYVGDVAGQPIAARWGIRKTGIDEYGQWPMEDVLEYQNTNGEWVKVTTRSGSWSRPTPDGKDQAWGSSNAVNHNQIYWEGIPDEENVSPIINTHSPNPSMKLNADNTGEISGILINRETSLGSTADWLTGITVVGGVTGNELHRAAGDGLIPADHYKIEHDTTQLDHLLTAGDYTAIGSGQVISTVTDYENDVTIFKQDIIVSTEGSPDIDIWLAGTDTPYAMQWMSNHQSADAWRQKGLDIQGHSTITGNYDLATLIDGSEAQSTEVTKSLENPAVTNEKILAWKNVNTPETGIPVMSRAYLVGNNMVALSAPSAAKYMRFDSTVPTISEVEFDDDSWTTIKSTDAADELSGLETASGGVFYKFVEHGETAGTATPTGGTDWISLKKYQLPSEAGEYDLYVYAKDNATNRSIAMLVNAEPIMIPEGSWASIRIEKKVADNQGNDTDIFLIHMIEESTLLGSVALTRDETSGWMALDMEEQESRTLEITEVVPMNYAKQYVVSVTNEEGSTAVLSEVENIFTVTVKPGDKVTITVENTFSQTGYFKDKDSVKNVFEK